MANHKNTLTAQQAQARKEWTDRWEELRTWAMRCTIRYCRMRLSQYGKDQWQDIRDEALSEAWRTITDDPSVTARKAISRAVDGITHELSRLNSIKCQNEALGEMPAHTQQYEDSQDNVRELIQHLPKRLRPLATLLSAGITETEDLMGYLHQHRTTIQKQRQALRKLLGSRFAYLLGDAMEVPIPRRLA